MNRVPHVVLSVISLLATVPVLGACSGAADPSPTAESSQAATSCLPGGSNPAARLHMEGCGIPPVPKPPTPAPKPASCNVTPIADSPLGDFPYMPPVCGNGEPESGGLTPAEEEAAANLYTVLSEIGCIDEVIYLPAPTGADQYTWPWATQFCPSAGLPTLESAGGWTLQDGALAAPAPLTGGVIPSDSCTGVPPAGYVVVTYLAGGPGCQGGKPSGCTSLACRSQ